MGKPRAKITEVKYNSTKDIFTCEHLCTCGKEIEYYDLNGRPRKLVKCIDCQKKESLRGCPMCGELHSSENEICTRCEFDPKN